MPSCPPARFEHPNSVDAKQLRRAEIEHAMRCLYRDPKWIGDMPVHTWLCQIHYLDTARYKGIQRRWLRNARVDGLCPVDELSADQRNRIIWQLLAFLRDGE